MQTALSTFQCPQCGKTSPLKIINSSGRRQCLRCGVESHETGGKPSSPRRFRSIVRSSRHLVQGKKAERSDGIVKALAIAFSFAGLCLLLKLGLTSSLTSAQASPVAKPAANPGFQMAWREQVRTLAPRYLAAPDVAALLPMTRRAEQQADKMQKYHGPAHPLPLGGHLTDTFMTSETESGDTLAMLVFEDDAGHQRPLVVARTPEGLKIDWPSLSGFGDMTLEEFCEKRPEVPTLLHVSAWRVNYFSFAYSDEQNFLCLRLSDAGDAHSLYGYLPRSQTEDMQKAAGLMMLPRDPALSGILPQGITVLARFSKEKSSNDQVEIARIICLGWFLP